MLAHGRDPYFPGWPDTLQLDYSNPATQDAMVDELVRIAARCSDIAPNRSRREGDLNIQAWTYSKNSKIRFNGISSGARVSAGRAIKFRASTNVSRPYRLHWQVVNTGDHAASQNALRGNFFKGKNLDSTETGNHDNWEQTTYTGSHWTQCFAVRGGVCVAQSDRFIINIWNREFPA